MKRILATCAAICAVAQGATAQEAENSILVLDASGSMWGQIDGTAKITIAQEVVAGLLGDLPASHAVGLTLYGHRRKGDCADIETVIAPGAARSEVEAAVRAVKPKGKTPMTDAVKAAAEALRFTEEKATVILISDGIETCNPDPCAAARLLEETGVDFTAHVVGFDVTDPKALAQMQCLAEETGGTFRTAANADELVSALQAVAIAPEPEVPVTVNFRAIEMPEGGDITDPLIWSLTGTEPLKEGHEAAGFAQVLLPGSYVVTVLRPSDEATAEARFTVAQAPLTVTLDLPTALPEASLEAPESAMAGGSVDVAWTGPGGGEDYIALALPDAEEAAWETYAYVRDGNPVAVPLPATEGAYELRYVMEGGFALARRTLTVSPVTATITAPQAPLAGAVVPVEWTGPDYSGDYLAVVPPGEDGWITYSYTRDGAPLDLRMPAEPGAYEIVYTMDRDAKIIARVPITVAAARFGLDLPATAAAGSVIDIPWTGPGHADDYVAITAPDAEDGAWITYAYMRDGNPARLTMPGTPGAYEVRYVQGQNTSVQARAPIEVTAVSAALQSPASVVIGTRFAVDWQGPNGEGDYLTIVPIDAAEGDYGNYSYTRDGSPLEITAPTEPGAYELRYVADTKPLAVLARVPLTVEAANVSLSAPATAAAGATVAVTWDGPDAPSDYIAVGDAERAYITYSYTRDGNPLQLNVPEEPGAYEIRYIMDQDGKVLATLPLLVE
ncbi:VWA domain-containing protein [Pseudoruegeria sp. SHC-113]|uniref:VWA domain-containing protein n=1 Tax=Pseudoruegeria sp. SHC-113 TaxID=2855439 RepID=UPI0021BAEFDC|nr:VWA domain-containing protein [Pseudoruegeria sp. SHC-113]MCT8160317.1 VWA domain-containing protein [Pseudoruegeria sp. SHC-113]